jgi:glycosyltransferase involved in cell wall biosynthesis
MITWPANSVEFLGHVEINQLKELYKICSVFAFPLTVETFGNLLVEAMACGCPIICSNAAAMPEIAGDAVIYVDPLSPSDISKAIVRFLDDGVLRAEFRKRAKKQSIIYSWAVSSKKQQNFLCEQPRTQRRDVMLDYSHLLYVQCHPLQDSYQFVFR